MTKLQQMLNKLQEIADTGGTFEISPNRCKISSGTGKIIDGVFYYDAYVNMEGENTYEAIFFALEDYENQMQMGFKD